jgi:hypothetical protein
MKIQFLIGIVTTPMLILSTGSSFAKGSMHSTLITRHTVVNRIQQSNVNFKNSSLNQLKNSSLLACPPRRNGQEGCGGW